MSLVTLYWVLIAAMLVGVIGAVIPGIPGSGLILAAVIIWGIANGFGAVVVALIVVILVFVVSEIIDLVAIYWGARRFGASKWGQIGAVVGLLLGLLGLLPLLPVGGPLFGLIVGALVGAFVGEFLYRSNLEFEPRLKTSLKAGIGVVVGSIIGNIIQGLLALVTVIVFVLTTWPPGAGT